jgi:drug/metabolite transporter (DMT)-like permease
VLGAGGATVALGLLSALAWGTADFGGGLLSRRGSLFGVVIVSLLVPFVVTASISRAIGEPFPGMPDLAWAVGAGVAAACGILGLYQGLAVGRMSVVAPVTGVLAATIPVLAGIALQGLPTPPVVVGIGLALVAVVLVSRVSDPGTTSESGVRYAIVGGVGLGMFNVIAGQLSDVGFYAQLAIIKAIEALLVAVVVVATRRSVSVPRRLLPAVGAVGLLDLTGNAGFILAAQAGELAVASVLSSLYPVTTIVLAAVFLRERVTRAHALGIVLAGVAIVLIATGPQLGAPPGPAG